MPNIIPDAPGEATHPASRALRPGEVVTVTGAVLYEVLKVDEHSYGIERSCCVTLRSLKSGRRVTRFAGQLWWPSDEPGKLGEPIVPSTTPIAAPAWFTCNRCCNPRQATERDDDARLGCAACGTRTPHTRVGGTEAQVREHDARLRRLQATEDMLEALGIRLRRSGQVAAARRGAEVWADRGRGNTTWFIDLADDLTVREQLHYLARAWAYLSPAQEPRWTEGSWQVDEDDPQMVCKGFGFTRSREEG